MRVKDKIRTLHKYGYTCIFGHSNFVTLVEKPLKQSFTDEQLQELCNGITYEEYKKVLQLD